MLIPAWHINYAAFPCRNLVDGSTAVARMGRTDFWDSEHGRTPIHLLLPHILVFAGCCAHQASVCPSTV